MSEVQAQKDFYNGIWFRSKLESKTAQAFDNLGIRYEYEPRGYKLSNGLWYKPDFWLPDAHQFVECKGVMDEIDSAKIYGLVEDENFPVVALNYNKAMLVMYEWHSRDLAVATYCRDIYIAQCLNCGKLWFVSIEDSYECQNCKAYDGDQHLSFLKRIDSATDLFEYGQRVAADKPIYRQMANDFNN